MCPRDLPGTLGEVLRTPGKPHRFDDLPLTSHLLPDTCSSRLCCIRPPQELLTWATQYPAGRAEHTVPVSLAVSASFLRGARVSVLPKFGAQRTNWGHIRLGNKLDHRRGFAVHQPAAAAAAVVAAGRAERTGTLHITDRTQRATTLHAHDKLNGCFMYLEKKRLI